MCAAAAVADASNGAAGSVLQIDLSDAGMRALLAEAKSAALAGWSGKQVIHPKQVRHQAAAVAALSRAGTALGPGSLSAVKETAVRLGVWLL